MYILREANMADKDLLINYKLSTIMEYVNNLEEKEIKRINDYVLESVLENLNEYKMIEINGKSVGCLLVTNYLEDVMIDEIYLEEDYRGQGIGSALLEKVLKQHSVVYLWVYKMNKRAIKLYESLGFKITKETETRYLMKFE